MHVAAKGQSRPTSLCFPCWYVMQLSSSLSSFHCFWLFPSEKCDPYKVPVEHVFRSNVLALEDAIRDPEVQIGGLVVLLDMAGLGFAHARYLSPHLAKRTVEVVQEGFPMRFKGEFINWIVAMVSTISFLRTAFHVLHEPFYMDAILSVLKPFLKDKIRRRVRNKWIINHPNSLSVKRNL